MKESIDHGVYPRAKRLPSVITSCYTCFYMQEKQAEVYPDRITVHYCRLLGSFLTTRTESAKERRKRIQRIPEQCPLEDDFEEVENGTGVIWSRDNNTCASDNSRRSCDVCLAELPTSGNEYLGVLECPCCGVGVVE